MSVKHYGVKKSGPKELSCFDCKIEEIKIRGFTILEEVLTPRQLVICSKKLDEIYAIQIAEFGKENLEKINELNLVRSPLLYDDFFLTISINERILEIVNYFLGAYFILNQQNGIINMPNEIHHQSSWHRDLPYQDYVISEPIALAALFCIDDFTEEMGGTYVIPHSHYLPQIPSVNYLNNYQFPVNTNKGNVILFDAMLYHKSGKNVSNRIRRGINNLYSIPLLTQQINISKELNGKYAQDPFLRKFLGYEVQIPANVNEWRKNRLSKLNK